MNDQSDVPHEFDQIPRSYLKHGTGRFSHVILVPQPTDSPNDPLNVYKLLLMLWIILTMLVANLEKRFNSPHRRLFRCCCWRVWSHSITWIRSSCR